VRAKEVFGQDSVIMVSQQFHNERAIYIARHFGLTAYGYNAKDVDASIGFKTNVREFFARLKVFIDLYTNAKPKFLGQKIKVGK
jgi:SanA protein